MRSRLDPPWAVKRGDTAGPGSRPRGCGLDGGYPFEVAIPTGLGVAGVVLADQVKSLDWRKRNAAVIAALPRQTVSAVLHKVNLLLAPSRAVCNPAQQARGFTRALELPRRRLVRQAPSRG